MDPTLRRLAEAGDGDDEVAVMVRLSGPSSPLPADARIVTQFGDFATVRVRRGAIPDLREDDGIASVKAPRDYRGEVTTVATDAESVEAGDDDRRRPAEGPTGRDVAMGIVDWGIDFRHPAFLRPDGGTRLIALWDQAAEYDPAHPNRFGYGRIHTADAINAALVAPDPVAALGYDPAAFDTGGGTHGTATASVAAGGDWPGGVPGTAPDADIVFVNLAAGGGLGHSAAVAEAVDFVREMAAGRPWVVSMSIGRHGGPHDGCTVLEQMLDAAVAGSPCGVIVNSAGNYFSNGTHATARIAPGEVLRIPMLIDAAMDDANEIDVWYPGVDRLVVGLAAPDDGPSAMARPGADATLTIDGRPAARLLHRLDDPNNGRNQAVLRIAPSAPAGTWELVVAGADVVDGRMHAWIEREATSPGTQARFVPDAAVTTTTTGTICNGRRNLAIGAYDHHDSQRPPATFSSSGDTVDGRLKPDALAPGHRVLVARSRPAGASAEDAPLSTRMSGTSLAAPYVAGTIASMMEVTGPAPAARLRSALLGSCERVVGDDALRAGRGYVDVAAAFEAVGEQVHEERALPAPAPAPPPVAERVLLPEAPPSLSSLEGRYFPSGGTDAAPFSTKSTVEPIIDGAAYFEKLRDTIGALKKGDAWYVTAWTLDPALALTATTPAIGNLLAEKAGAGVDVRVIIWVSRTLLESRLARTLAPAWTMRVTTANVLAAEKLRAIKVASGGTPLSGRVLLDWSGNRASSHHAKLNVFSVGGKLTAFAGGIDLHPDRAGVPPHTTAKPWHDATTRLTGDAAASVLDTFVSRWDEASTLAAATYDVGAGPKPYNPAPVTPFTPAAAGPAIAASADTSIQVVRSWPAVKNSFVTPPTGWASLPAAGVHEARRTFQQMLGAAQKYIYVEDQGFDAVNALFPSLVDACKRGVKVIALVPGVPDPVEGTTAPINASLSTQVTDGILKKLTAAEQKNLAVWRLADIFVHSKLILVDDELMSIGSANFMDRSMEFTTLGDDSECTVVTVSTTKRVADLRVRLWAEHLRVGGPAREKEIRDLSKSLGFWRAAWGTGLTFKHPDTKLAFVGPI